MLQYHGFCNDVAPFTRRSHSYDLRAGNFLSHAPVRKNRGWDMNTTTPLNDLYLNPHAADLSTVDTSGNDLLGFSIQSICETIPSSFRILHVESVFRDDLI